MEILLLVVAAAAFIGFAVNYFRIAFAVSNLWVVLGILIPPSCIAFYILFGRKYRAQAMLHGVSFVALILFSVLYIRAHPFDFDQTRFAQLRNWLSPAFADTPMAIETLPYATDAELDKYMAVKNRTVVRVQGHRMRVARVILNDNMLRFKTRSKSGSRIEIAIDLAEADIANPNNFELDLTPELGELPAIYIHLEQGSKAQPIQTTYDHGYWLETTLSKISDHQYEGFVNLKLPDGQKSFLVGHFTAQDRDLIWEYEDVNRSYDSNHTIEYIAEQYLVNKLGSSLAGISGFSDTYFQSTLADASGQTRVHITLSDGSEHQVNLSLFKGEFGWAVEHAPVRDLIAALKTISTRPAAAIDSHIETSEFIEIPIEELETVVGKSVMIMTSDGREREGVVKSVDPYNVSLSTRMGSGSMAMLIRRREVREVLLYD